MSKDSAYVLEPLGGGLVSRRKKNRPAQVIVHMIHPSGTMVPITVDTASMGKEIAMHRHAGFVLVSQYKTRCKDCTVVEGRGYVITTREEGSEEEGNVEVVEKRILCPTCKGTTFAAFKSPELEAEFNAIVAKRSGAQSAKAAHFAASMPGAAQRQADATAAATAALEGFARLVQATAPAPVPAPAVGKGR